MTEKTTVIYVKKRDLKQYAGRLTDKLGPYVGIKDAREIWGKDAVIIKSGIYLYKLD